MDYEKHTGIYESEEDFEANLSSLSSPWVAYVKDSQGEYNVHFSENPNVSKISFDEFDERLRILETENKRVFLSSKEYDMLIENQEADIKVMSPDGTVPEDAVTEHITFDPLCYYYVYEE